MDRKPLSRDFNDFYEFDAFRLEARERRLWRGAELIALKPKVFDTLLLLVQNAGHLVTKEDLMSSLWPDAVVDEGNLTKNVWLIRKALGDTDDGSPMIETVPRIGYRFAAPTRIVLTAPAPVPPPAATEVAAAADERPEQESAPAAASTGAAELPPRRPSRFVVPVGIALLAVAGIAAFFMRSLALTHQTRKRSPVPAVQARRSIAVLGFSNLSGRADAAWLSTAVTEMISAELAAGQELRVVPAESVARRRLVPSPGALSPETLSRLRASLNADEIVTGSYAAIPAPGGEQIRVDLLVQEAGSGETIAAVSESGSESDLFGLISAAGQELRAKLGMTEPTAVEASTVKASLPSNPEATRLYAEGLGLLRRGEASAAQDLLERSERIEPDFALTHAALSEAWTALGYDGRAEEEAWKASEHSEGLSREERLEINGRLAQARRKWDEAVRLYQSLWKIHPDDPEYGLSAARTQIAGGRAKDALTTVLSLRKLPSPQAEDPRIDLVEAEAAAAVSDYRGEKASAARAGEKAQRLGEGILLAQARMREADAMDSLGDYSGARPKYEEARTLYEHAADRGGAAEARRRLAGLIFVQGHFPEARTLYEQALESFHAIGDRRGEAATLTDLINLDWMQTAGLAQLERELDQLRALNEEVGDRAGMAWALNGIGTVAWDQGELARAMDLHRQALAISRQIANPDWEAWSLESIGDVLHSGGQLQSARQNYADALAIRKRVGNESGRARTLSSLSDLLLDMGLLSEAGTAAQEAMAIQARLGESETHAESELSFAEVLIATGRWVEAARLAEEASAEFQKEREAANEALAQGARIRALLALGRTQEAGEAAGRVRTLLRGVEQNEILPAKIACARADAAAGRVKPARQEVEDILQKARRIGWVNFQMDARLALGQIDLESGDPARGRTELEALARDASASGFGRVRDEARRLLDGRPPRAARGQTLNLKSITSPSATT